MIILGRLHLSIYPQSYSNYYCQNDESNIMGASSFIKKTTIAIITIKAIIPTIIVPIVPHPKFTVITYYLWSVVGILSCRYVFACLYAEDYSVICPHGLS